MIDYILQGFGFTGWRDFIQSSFGHTFSLSFIAWDIVVSAFIGLVHFLFGFNHLFLAAYVVLIFFEWITGVLASLNLGERHESRKFGRMLLKILTYLLLIYVLHTFEDNIRFPAIGDFEFDPFHWLYWAVLLAIIWQLVVSLLENLECLGFRFAGVLLKIINKKFFHMFDIEDEYNEELEKNKNKGNDT